MSTRHLSEKLIKELVPTTYTQADFYYRLELLKEFFESVFFHLDSRKKHVGTELHSYLNSHEKDEVTRKSLQSISHSFLLECTQNNLYQIIEEAKNMVEALPHVVIYLPTSFSHEGVTEIGEWFRENLDKSLILVAHNNSHVVGGCAFVWNGKYHDYSFHHFARATHEELVSSVSSQYKKYVSSTNT